jgi:colanic acid biosynthesis protein WcaH
MDVHDEHIPEETFGACLDALPQVCVEVLLVRDGHVLVARRTNEPANGEWFWPGGRLYKGERLDDAARRIGREELGLDVELDGRVGVYSHFWDIASVDGADSRHTVNVAYRVRQRDPDASVTLDDQHDDYRFVTGEEDDLHEYVQLYFENLDLSD